MSKISEYQEQVRTKAVEAKAKEEAERQSVSEFAAELLRPTESLLMQLSEAGISKLSGSDKVTITEKVALLTYLQRPQGSIQRKKITITIESEEQKLIKRAANQENGAEFEALNHFAGLVVFGHAIDPTFQEMVNLIVARAVLIGALPLEKLGRPKREELNSIGLAAAHRYWEMVDSGIGYEQAVETLSREFHKSERHIMRLIAPHKRIVGETLEIRTQKRRWNELMLEMYSGNSSALDDYKALCEPRVPFPELNLDDFLEHLEELTGELAARVKPLTKKI